MNNLTFVFFSYNDSKRIEQVIRNVRAFGEILVFDDSSTDNTKEVVERLGVPFIIRPKTEQRFIETAETFAFVKQHLKTPWVYWGWTDVLLPRPLLEKMVAISKQDRYKHVFVPMYTYLWGDIQNPMAKTSYPLFFMHDHMDFSQNRVHNLGRFLGKPDEILHLPQRDEYALRHFSLYNLEKYVHAHLRYTEIEVQDKVRDGRKVSTWYLFGSMGRYFLIYYRHAYKSGLKGLFVSLLYAFWRLMVTVRWYEVENGLTLENIEDRFNELKEEIVREAEIK